MSIICNGTLKVKCNKCGHINAIVCSDLPFKVIEIVDRSMGPETHLLAEYEFNCENCGNEIKISYSVWTYPSGTINHVDILVDGGTVIQECNIEVEP